MRQKQKALDTVELEIKVIDEQLEQINIVKDAFHGDWNYVIFSPLKK